MLIHGTIVLIISLQCVHSRAVIQSDNIGETMDGPNTITFNMGQRSFIGPPGAQIIWNGNWTSGSGYSVNKFR